jgi:PAS domain S-box-containing protein
LPNSNPERAGLATAVAQVADGVAITDLEGKIQYVNPAFTAMTGYTSAEVIGQHTRILKSGCQAESFYQQLWATITSGEVWHGEMINRRKDGTLYWEEMRISPVRDAKGETISYIAIKRDVTEQRAAREARRFLAAIVEGSGDAISAFNRAGIILTWNHGAEVVFGHAAREVIGEHFSMLVTPEERPRWDRFAEAIFEGAAPTAPAAYECYGLRKDGQRIYLAVTACFMSPPAEEEAAISVILRDITKPKEMEEALRETEARFRIMANSCPTAMWVTDAEGAVQFVNRAYREFFGITTEEFGEFQRQLLVHPEDARDYFGTFRRTVKERVAFRAEARVRRADGEWRWFASHAEPRLAANGEYLGHGGISTDVTDRRLAEQTIRDSQEFAQATIDTLSSHVCVLDETGTILAVNRAWTAFAEANRKMDDHAHNLSGGSGAGVNYLAWCEQMAGMGTVGGAQFASGVRSVLNAKCQQYTQEYSCHSLDGRRWFIGKVTRFLTGGLPRILIDHIDITDLKLAQELSVKAMQSAEEASKAKSRFLANMSHEIRTPMNLIMGMNSLLLESALDHKQRQHVQISYRNLRRLLRLINGILDLSKVEAGKLTLEAAPFDLYDLIAECTATISSAVERKGLRIEASIDPDVWRYWIGDAERIQQVLLNLVGNSIKFTARGKIEVRVSSQPGQEGKNGLRFEVTDTGCGVPPDQADMIFEAFEQADVSLNRPQEGTGLGLSIAKTLVELMSGRIWVEKKSEPGAKFIFTAMLPSTSENAVRDRLPASFDNQAALLAGTRVLVVEDNPENMLLVRAYLENLSLVLDFATNGFEAVEKRRQGVYDIVLMDIQMPIMDGYTATRKIRTWEKAHALPPVPIVALTAHALSEASVQSLEAGCDGHLTKPVERNDLVAVIAKFAKPPMQAGVAISVDPIAALRPAYLANRWLDLAKLRDALTTRDFSAIQNIGHDCKGTGTGYGFPNISKIGSAIETAAKVMDADKLKESIWRFERCIQAASTVNKT